jgi:hypothetical protein
MTTSDPPVYSKLNVPENVMLLMKVFQLARDVQSFDGWKTKRKEFESTIKDAIYELPEFLDWARQTRAILQHQADVIHKLRDRLTAIVDITKQNPNSLATQTCRQLAIGGIRATES